jgi:hypothetical protein
VISRLSTNKIKFWFIWVAWNHCGGFFGSESRTERASHDSRSAFELRLEAAQSEKHRKGDLWYRRFALFEGEFEATIEQLELTQSEEHEEFERFWETDDAMTPSTKATPDLSTMHNW